MICSYIKNKITLTCSIYTNKSADNGIKAYKFYLSINTLQK